MLLVVSALVAASWAMARQSSPGQTADVAEDYFSNAMYRTSVGTDKLIEGLQARLRSNSNDWASYSQLGLAYLQKARETGDPTYYPKAEGVIKRALSIEPEDYAAMSAMGALALALQLLAGHPQETYMTLIVLGIFGAVRAPWRSARQLALPDGAVVVAFPVLR